MSSVFLLGAGASHGSLDCLPSCPPLSRDLYSLLRANGGISATFEPPLVDAFVNDFERGMAEFAKRGSKETASLLRDMSMYFMQFEPGPRNLYRKLVDLVGLKEPGAVLGTLNYDLLIEQAICEAGLGVYFGDATAPDKSLHVLKIHGSCNFLPDLPPLWLNDVEFSSEHDAPNLDGPVRLGSRKEIVEFCRRENSIAPAIAVFAEGKPVPYCREFVRTQQRAWTAEVATARLIFVIGVKVHPPDGHVWSALASTPGRVFYVGPDPDPFLKWAADVGQGKAGVLADTFEHSLPLIAEELDASA